MRSPKTLQEWLRQLLPTPNARPQVAGGLLVRALLVGFTTNLAQLARQPQTRLNRQFLARWLGHGAWQPTVLYAHLNHEARRLLRRLREVPLLVDFTLLDHTWAVLQVSLPWQQRALPLYRAVLPFQATGRTALVRDACTWLRQHLPGPPGRYLLVMDRGFPSPALVQEWTAAGWRFVLRVSAKWKMTHPECTGVLRDAIGQPSLVTPDPAASAPPSGAGRAKGRTSGVSRAWCSITGSAAGSRGSC